MLTHDKSRKKTPGGIFFTLLRQFATPQQLKDINCWDRKWKAEVLARQREERRKRAGQAGKKGGSEQPPSRRQRLSALSCLNSPFNTPRWQIR